METRLQVTDLTNGLSLPERVSVGLSGAALVLALLTAVSTLDDDRRADALEDRLVCLELPGPNDCGVDGH